MTPLDQFGTNYLTLTLEINKHIDGYVDSYIGPADLKSQVEAGEQKPPQTLMADLENLRASLPSDDPQRAKFLTAEFRAIDCTLRMLDGEEFDYLDEVNRLFDINPQLLPEENFTQAHNQLDIALPGGGDLPERFKKWRASYDIPAEKLPDLIELAKRETRSRTTKIIDLIEGESIEIELLGDKPWSANNVYQGNAHSLVEWNTDILTNATALANIIAHEAYPGHHTEAMLKDELLYKGKGYAEIASLLLNSPGGVIAEAIATTALEIIFPDDSHIEWTTQTAISAAGLPPISTNELGAIMKAYEGLGGVAANAAIKYHTGDISQDEVVEYIQTYGLTTKARAKKSFDFMSHPLYRAYIFTYTEGKKLLAQAAAGSDKLPIFKHLLVEQVLPSELVGD